VKAFGIFDERGVLESGSPGLEAAFSNSIKHAKNYLQYRSSNTSSAACVVAGSFISMMNFLNLAKFCKMWSLDIYRSTLVCASHVEHKWKIK
jgi:hypothetical protein